MGLETATVVPQTEPIRLELLGTTEYDSDNQTRIRPLFKGRVDRVYAKVGQLIKKGEPLIEFYSTDLAEAKNACEIERIQWVFCNNLLKVRENLSKTNAISRQSYLEAQNDEMKDLREYEVARDKLLVYGLTEEEVAKVKDEVGSQKARMTFRSPASGIVITRDVVPGNVYDDDDTLARHRTARSPLGLGQRLRERPRPDQAGPIMGDSVPVPDRAAARQGRIHLQQRRRRHACREGAYLDRQHRWPDQVRHAGARVAGNLARSQPHRGPSDRPGRRCGGHFYVYVKLPGPSLAIPPRCRWPSRKRKTITSLSSLA